MIHGARRGLTRRCQKPKTFRKILAAPWYRICKKSEQSQENNNTDKDVHMNRKRASFYVHKFDYTPAVLLSDGNKKPHLTDGVHHHYLEFVSNLVHEGRNLFHQPFHRSLRSSLEEGCDSQRGDRPAHASLSKPINVASENALRDGKGTAVTVVTDTTTL